MTPNTGDYGVQYLEVTAQSATAASWDSTNHVDPVYRAFVPVYVDPPAPVISSVSVGGKAVSGSTFANNSTTATEFSFDVTGVVAGATVSVFADGGTTPIATGTVASGDTTITLTTDGKTTIANGSHEFTVKQTIATTAATLYAGWTSTSTGVAPGAEYPIAASSVDSPASAGTALTIGLAVLEQPNNTAQAGALYQYVLATNAPSGDTVTVNQSTWTLPTGMTYNATTQTFTWTPTTAQANTSPEFSATVSDSEGNTTSIGPVDISVILGLAPIDVPANATSGGNVSVSFSGSQLEVYDNIGKAAVGTDTFKASDVVTIDLPANQANAVSITLPSSSSAATPKELLIQGATGSTNNQVTLVGPGWSNTFTLGVAGADTTVTGNGLVVTLDPVQKLTLQGKGVQNDFALGSSSVPTTVMASSGSNTLDFSSDTAPVNVNLGLNSGTAQSMWGMTNGLSIYGVINKLIGTAKQNDVLIAGPATTEIVAGAGNDTIKGGSGNNILIGGGGNDTIIGGTGRNLIIAGAGNSTIYANGWQNTVYAGTTNLSGTASSSAATSSATNDQALLSLLNQGPRAGLSAASRRAKAATVKNPLAVGVLSFQDTGATDTIIGSLKGSSYILGKNSTLKS